MRNWASKATADWWVRANDSYDKRQGNKPSEDYILSRYNFNSVLEIGSGTGRLINKLPGNRGALDINWNLLKLIDDNVAKYNWDISKELPEIPKYELVFTYQVLQHLNHGQFLKALRNIQNIASKEIWLIEGQVQGWKDGSLTHHTGSYHHDYQKYLKCYQIDSLHGGKIKVFRSRI